MRVKATAHVHDVFCHSRCQPVRWRRMRAWGPPEMSDVARLIAAYSVFLDVYESLTSTSAGVLAASTRELADSAMAAAREAMAVELALPGDARHRRALLEAAIELDGLESPLAALAARRLAEAAEAGALQAA